MMNTSGCFKTFGYYAGRDNLDYGIMDGDKVLDIGGGSKPFKLATHVLDSSLKEYDLQRYNANVKLFEGQVLIEGTTDRLAEFNDNEFDFIYSSHTLEHIEDLPRVIPEISRIGARGFVAVPQCLYDFWAVPLSSGHKWFCDYDYENDVFLIKKREHTDFVDFISHVWGNEVMWGDKGRRNLVWRNIFEGHNCVNIRMFWEIRFFWKDKIDFRIDNAILPQLNLFKETMNNIRKEKMHCLL